MEETSNNRNESLTVKERIARERELILEQFKKTPIVQIACEKTGIGRATYYRWRKEDPEFAALSDQAIYEGKMLINDLAESQLLSQIRDKNMTAIIFWLKNNHPSYTTKLEITAISRQAEPELTVEEQEQLKRALELASLIPTTKVLEDSKDE